jgi:hypothetical protein
MSRCSIATHSPGRIPVAAAKGTIASRRGSSHSVTSSISSQDSKGRFSVRRRCGFSTPCFAGLTSSRPQYDRAGEHLPKRLHRLEPVTKPDRHPPAGDLDRIELVEAVVAGRRHLAVKQKAQLPESDGRGLVLCEVLVDELREGRHSTDPAAAA